MSLLNEISNKYILIKIFSFTGKQLKLKLLKYNKNLQTKLDLDLFEYKKNIFYDTPKINLNNLLSYYDYLKRAFKNIYSMEIIKNYYVEFFCKYLKEKKIIFELDCTHELANDILLNEKLGKIKIVINIEKFKKRIIDNIRSEINKKPFIKLFRIIFNNPKIIQFIILENDEISQKNDFIEEKENYLPNIFYNNLLENLIIYGFPSLKTNSLSLIQDLNDKKLDKNKFNLIEVIIPSNSIVPDYTYDFLNKIPCKFIHEKKAFDISNLIQIDKFGIKNVHIKLEINEENSRKLYNMKIKIDFKNIKRLELIFDNKNTDIYFSKSSNNINNNFGEEAFNEGKLFMNQFFYQNYYLKKIYDLYKQYYKGYKIYFKLLEELDKCKFDFFWIGDKSDFYFYYINKITNSIGFSLSIKYYNEKFFKKLSNYEDVKIRVITKKNLDDNNNNYNQEIKNIKIFKYEPDSKIKHFSFRHGLKLFVYTNIENFPINFNNLITLELGYNICNGVNLIFPLFEEKCQYDFYNLKKLIVYLDIHCERCLSNFPLDIFKNFGKNLKFCENLEILSISVDEIKSDINEIIHIIDGLKILKYLKEFYLIYTNEEYEIDENKFYLYNSQYVKYFPFLNKIRMVLSDFTIADLLYEKKVDYSINDVIINNYKYLNTLGETKSESYITYLCKDEKENKVILRKFKKSRIKVAEECFENEKYCLKKFRQNRNVINYIEFLEDENYEYIVYEYIPNSRKYFRSKILSRQVLITLYENIYKNALIDKNILLYPISPSDILITENFEIIILGFGYLNLFKNAHNRNIKKLIKYYNIYEVYDYGFYLHHYIWNFIEYYANDLNKEFFYNNFYMKKGKEIDNKFDSLINTLKQKNDEYFKYKNSIQKFLPKFSINKKILFEEKCKEGKIYYKKNNIYILKSHTIKIYNEPEYNLENNILIKEEDEYKLKNLFIFEKNILMCVDEISIYIIYLEKNNNKSIKKYIINEIKNKINLDNDAVSLFYELIKIRNTNYFITSGNIICLWNIDKDLNFIKKYDNLSNFAIFEFKNNLAKFIGINHEKIIFFNISENYEIEIFKQFDFNFIKSYRVKKFVQEDDKFFIVDNYQIIEFRINLEKGILIPIFCHKFKGLNNSSFNSFFKYKSGIIGTKGYSKTLIYLSFKKKKNRKYKEIDFYLIPDNESINDFLYSNNKIYILEKSKLLILEFNFK